MSHRRHDLPRGRCLHAVDPRAGGLRGGDPHAPPRDRAAAEDGPLERRHRARRGRTAQARVPLPLHAGLLNLGIHAQFLMASSGSLVARNADIIPGAGNRSLIAGAGEALRRCRVAWLSASSPFKILSRLLAIPARSVGARVRRRAGSRASHRDQLDSLRTLSWAPGLHRRHGVGILLLAVGIAGLLAAHFLRATVRGFELRAVGANPRAAVAAGVDVDAMQTLMMQPAVSPARSSSGPIRRRARALARAARVRRSRSRFSAAAACAVLTSPRSCSRSGSRSRRRRHSAPGGAGAMASHRSPRVLESAGSCPIKARARSRRRHRAGLSHPRPALYRRGPPTSVVPRRQHS